MYDFGLRLKQLREKHNLSQSQVAKRLGITRAAISSYENNISLPSVNVLAELALLYPGSLPTTCLGWTTVRLSF